MKKTILAMQIALVALCICVTAQKDDVDCSQNVAEMMANEASLEYDKSVEELAMRLLELEQTYTGNYENNDVQLLVGRLPYEIPIDLPIPEEARIVGSAIVDQKRISVVLDVNLTPEQVFAFYEERMADNNWTVIYPYEQNKIALCQDKKSPSLIVSAYPIENGPTDVRLDIHTDPKYLPCRTATQYLVEDMDRWECWLRPVPKQDAPPDSMLAPHGYDRYVSVGRDFVGTGIMLETDMNSSSLVEYYGDQFESADWTKLTEVHNDSLTWSEWTLQDEDAFTWKAILWALDLPETINEHFVGVQAKIQSDVNASTISTAPENVEDPWNEPSVEELATRLMEPVIPGILQEVQLLAGKIPDNMPVDLPMPDDARIVGSEVLNQKKINIVLDVNQTPEQILDFYREQMASDNWSEIEQQRGFAFNERKITLCQGNNDPPVIIRAYTIDNGPTDVRIEIDTDPQYSPCKLCEACIEIDDNWQRDDWLKPLPPLIAPDDSKEFNQGYGTSGDDFASTSISMETSTNSSVLVAHYGDQIEAANWTKQAEGHNGPLAWSTWTLHDEESQSWRAFLWVVDLPGMTNGRFVGVQANIKD